MHNYKLSYNLLPNHVYLHKKKNKKKQSINVIRHLYLMRFSHD